MCLYQGLAHSTVKDAVAIKAKWHIVSVGDPALTSADSAVVLFMNHIISRSLRSLGMDHTRTGAARNSA
eukprot:10435850-Karenia_brevis.AAC.1